MDRLFLALALLSASLIRATAAVESNCPLSYDPVVDAESGIPFYNDCLARRQLGETAVLVSHQEVLESAEKARRLLQTTEDAGPLPGAQDYLSLVPAPANPSELRGEGVISSRTISRYASEGFFYVGRPGFLDGEPSPRSQTTGRDTVVPASVDGSRVSLRMTYPEGDMYIKVWKARALEELVAAQTSTEGTSMGLNLPSAPDGTAPGELTDDAGETSTAFGGRRSLRMQTVEQRTEVLNPAYPLTAVSYITSLSYSTWCSGTLIGSTGRLALTAAHCLFKYDFATRKAVGFYKDFYATVGQYRQAGKNSLVTPNGRAGVGLVEVHFNWMRKGRYEADIGLMRLNYHLTAPGTLGFDYKCPAGSTMVITTAGYAADVPLTGSLWSQKITVSASVCNERQNTIKDDFLEKGIPYAYAPGLNGSALWNADNVVRYVMTGSDPSAAAAITSSIFAWITDFTSRNIINLTPQILVNGLPGQARKYLMCDTTTMQCVSTTVKAQATSFFSYPVRSTGRFAFQVVQKQLCLTNSATGVVNLAPCNQDNRFIFENGTLWLSGPTVSAKLPVSLKSGLNELLKYNGDNQPVVSAVASKCTTPSDCAWVNVKP